MTSSGEISAYAFHNVFREGHEPAGGPGDANNDRSRWRSASELRRFGDAEKP
jgi:hypothetical protein